VEGKWRTFDREYTGRAATLEGIFYRARKNGWQDTWLQDRLKEYRFWLASPDAIDTLKQPIPAPSEDDPERTRKLFSNPERGRKMLDAILQKCEADQSLRITPGYDWLRKETGIAQGSIGDYLARLFTGGFINLQPGEKGGKAAVIELVLQDLNSINPSGETIQVVKNWKIYREFRTDEAFLNNHAVYVATHTQAWLAQRYIGHSGKRLSKPRYEGEGLPLGDNGLGALLALLDGPTTISDAAELVGYTYGAMARTMRRYLDHGLVGVTVGERNRKTYTLKEEWRAILDTNRPKMTTCTIQWGRDVGALKSKSAYLEHRGEDEKAAKVNEEYERKKVILEGARDELGIIPFVQPGRVDPHTERLNRLKHAYVAGERAEHRPKHRTQTEADKWRQREYAKSAAAAESEWDELNAWATMQHGPGWWARRDKTDIIGQYHVFKLSGDRIPTMHWAGGQAVAA
jgi:DNA-binding PadR family transcriptional regulator